MANYTDVFPDTVTLETDIGTNTTNIGTNTTNIGTNTTDIGTNASDISALQSIIYGEVHGTVDNVTLTATIGTVVYLTNYSDGSVGAGGVTINQATGVIGIATAGKYDFTVWVRSTLDANKSYNAYLTIEQDDNGTVTTEVVDAIFPTNATETLGFWRMTSTLTIPVTGSITNLRIGLSADSAVSYTGIQATFRLRTFQP